MIYVVCLDGFRPGAVFARSRDHGASWSKAVRLDGKMHYSDKPTLAISPQGKDVYVSYNARYALYVSASHDYGATWSAPVRATAKRRWYYSLSGAVGRDGAVWFAVDGETGKNETGNGHVSLVTSPMAGELARDSVRGQPRRREMRPRATVIPISSPLRMPSRPTRRGNLVFVFAKNDRSQGPNALYASRSSDDGATWSRPR